ncbi:UDP-glucuronosyltransferase 2B15-like [Argonauta hians]
MNLLRLCTIMAGLLAGGHYTEADNVLFLSWPFFSHIQTMAYVATELGKYGHTSYFPMTDDIAKKFKSLQNIEIMKMKPDGNVTQFTEDVITLFLGGNKTKKDMFKKMDTVCDNFLFNEEWFQTLKQVNATMAVVDYVFMSNCLAVIPYRLSIPFVFQGGQPGRSMAARDPLFPVMPLGVHDTSKVSLYQRVKAALIGYGMHFIKPMGAPSRSVKEYAPEMPDISYTDLYNQAQLFLLEKDLLLEPPEPSHPNVKLIGGVAARKGAPLKGDISKFVENSKHGIIVVSFGSVVSKVPEEHLKKMEMAFKELRYDVIWKRSDLKSPASNIYTTQWLPQNDLLGHPKTKLFITHCGNNGQFEALFHGVAMLGFPVFADQYHNAQRIVAKEYGLSMDMFHYTKDELIATIKELIKNPKYNNNIKKASKIYNSRPEHPAAKGARYVDHVMKYGGDHLRTASQTMPLYQFLMLDVHAVFLLLLVVLLYLLKLVFTKCSQLLFGAGKKNKTD